MGEFNKLTMYMDCRIVVKPWNGNPSGEITLEDDLGTVALIMDYTELGQRLFQEGKKYRVTVEKMAEE